MRSTTCRRNSRDCSRTWPSSSRTPRRREQAEFAGTPDGWLYGLYEGVPATEWGADWVALPNKISLFRLPLEADFPDPVDLEDEVRVTVIHELAHHAGIDDERLHELDLD